MERKLLKPLLRSWIVLGWLGVVPLGAHAAEPVFPTASRIGLVPPPGMKLSRRLQGFEDVEKQAVIAVAEFTAQTYGKLQQEFTAEALRADGFELESREVIRASNYQGFLVAARQAVGGVLLHKWALVIVEDEVTAVMVAVVPQAAADAYPDGVIRGALTSFVLRPKLSAQELLDSLPYVVTDLAGFRPLTAALDGTAVLTYGARDTSLPGEQPFFLIALRSGEIREAAEREPFARRLLALFVDNAQFRPDRSEPLKVGGHDFHEIVGTTLDRVTDPAASTELEVVQWIRFGTGSHLQMLGIARKDRWDSVFPRMRALRDGISPKNR